jgi:hypothetical protein
MTNLAVLSALAIAGVPRRIGVAALACVAAAMWVGARREIEQVATAVGEAAAGTEPADRHPEPADRHPEPAVATPRAGGPATTRPSDDATQDAAIDDRLATSDHREPALSAAFGSRAADDARRPDFWGPASEAPDTTR